MFNVQEFKVNFHLAELKPTLSRKRSQFQSFQPFNRFAPEMTDFYVWPLWLLLAIKNLSSSF